MGRMVIYPTGDRKVREHVKLWILSAGGRVPLEELKLKFKERFEYEMVYSTDQSDVQTHQRRGVEEIYVFENGEVSLPHAH